MTRFATIWLLLILPTRIPKLKLFFCNLLWVCGVTEVTSGPRICYSRRYTFFLTLELMDKKIFISFSFELSPVVNE